MRIKNWNLITKQRTKLMRERKDQTLPYAFHKADRSHESQPPTRAQVQKTPNQLNYRSPARLSYWTSIFPREFDSEKEVFLGFVKDSFFRRQWSLQNRDFFFFLSFFLFCPKMLLMIICLCYFKGLHVALTRLTMLNIPFIMFQIRIT